MGTVSYISVDQSAKGNRGVVVGSDTGVLGVLDPHDGTLRESIHMWCDMSSTIHILTLGWRQVYESHSSGSLDVVLRSRYGCKSNPSCV